MALDTSNVIRTNIVTVQTMRDMVNDPRLDAFLDAEVVPVIAPIPGQPDVTIDGRIEVVAVTRDKDGTLRMVLMTTLNDVEGSIL